MPKKKSAEIPIRHLTVLLLKRNIELPTQALKEPASLKMIDLKPDSGVDGVLFIRPPKKSTPPWVAFLEQGTTERLPDLANTSTAAVLFVRSGEDLVAYCFGRGRAFLRPDSIEFTFGLKVALNAVDPEKLRSLDSRAFEQMTLQTRRQASRATTLQGFGVDVTSDLLRSVTGEPRDATLAVRLTGRDALVLDARVLLSDLQRQTERLLELQESTAYRADFDWVDDLQLIKAPTLIDALQQNLLHRLRAGDTTRMHLATPGVIDYDDVVGYTFSVESDNVMRPDPDVSDYLKALHAGPESISLAMLKRHQIGLRVADYDEPVTSWSVYKGLVVETEYERRSYVLSEGEWYVVAKTLSDSVRTFMEQFESATTNLPAAAADEDERNYNERAAKELDWVLTDRQTVKPAGARTPLEFCDLLSPSKHIVHVKPRTSSSTLSHLFGQAFASGEAFLYDGEFREQLRGKLGAKVSDLIPVDAPKAQDYEVTFAIIGGTAKDWPHSLPFLSKLNFRNVVKRLRRFGYRVSLTHVVRD
ncbi:MAG TPA: DUF6119 family protein [Thermoanaerobaculia bacterium]